MYNKIWETRKSRSKIGYMITPLWLCECGCNEIVYGGNQFKHNHHFKGKNNYMKNPKNSQRISLKLKQYWKNSNNRQKASKIRKEWWEKHPEQKEKASKCGKEFMNRPDQKKRLSELIKITKPYEYITEETKKLWSKQRSGKNHPQYGKIGAMKGRFGKSHPMYGRQSLHSKKCYEHLTPFQGIRKMFHWEYLYAKYLDSINEPYWYEPQHYDMIINNKETSYTPDFYLPKFNEFVEIKGYWRDDALLKSIIFEQELPYPFKYNVLYKKDLKNLGIDIKNPKKENT